MPSTVAPSARVTHPRSTTGQTCSVTERIHPD